MKVLSKHQNILGSALLALLYAVAGKLCLHFASIAPSASPIWVPSGIALAALLVYGYRFWPGVFIGAFIVNITTAGSLFTSLGISAGNTLEALTAAYLLNGFADGPHALDRAGNLLKYIAMAGFLATTISAVIGVTSLALGGFVHWSEFGPIALTWWLGDVGGNILVAPLIIMLAVKSWPERWVRAKTFEVAFFGAVLVYLSLIVFSEILFPTSANMPLAYLCIPPVVCIAYRLGRRITAAACFILASIALWGTLHGMGPFVRDDLNLSILLTDAFVDVIAIMGMLLAAVVSEREESVSALRVAHDDLELRVQERTISLGNTVSDLKAEVAQRKAIEHTLRESQERFSLLIENVKDYAIYMLDPTGKVVSWNAGAERITGYTAAEVIGRDFSMFFTKDEIASSAPQRELAKARAEGRLEHEGHRLRKDGSVFWADIVMTALLDKRGELRGFAKVTRDITERRKAEKTLRESEERFQQLVKSNIIGFMRLDDSGKVMEVNDALLKILGYGRDEFLGPDINEATITPTQFRTLDDWMKDRLEAGGTCPAIEKEFIRKDGCRIPVLVGMVLLTGTDHHRLCFVIDVTERRSAQDALRKAYDELEIRVQQRTAELQEEVLRRQRAEEELKNQAIRDSLSGLYNRRGFMTLAENTLQLARRQGASLLLFMGDLDDLKKINDQYGHAEGDYALTQISELLRRTFRQSDVIARIGGDEFAVVGIEDPDHTESTLIERLQANLDDYNRYSGRHYRLHLSVGVTRVEPGSTAVLEHHMQEADVMLYDRKRNKEGSVLKFPPVS